jgi:twitching motility protein PilT
MDMVELLTFANRNKASDLHLSVGVPPALRINGDIRYLEIPPLNTDTVKNMIWSIMPSASQAYFDENWECDFAFEIQNVSRFRINISNDYRGMSAVCRDIPSKVLTLQQLNAPKIFADLMSKEKGMILVTGPTGSGKSTTLAAMIDHYNTNTPGKILTVEDPIEFVHVPKKAFINQRELGNSTKSWVNALKHALRQDPDLILVGELRDLETIELALTAAETGHLVLGTLHSSTAAKTINRIIDVFPEDAKAMVRTMLAESLEAVISQSLIKTKDGSGRVAAHEIMLGNPAIRNLIRENKIAQMYSSIQTGQAMGMQTMDQSLEALVKSGKISATAAKMIALEKSKFGG